MINEPYKISIIVPVYNLEACLPRCLDSILNQTYKNLEIIVVSDGSTDGSNQIIEEYARRDSRIVPVYKKNSGVSDTRNKGLEIAKGDYIGFVDGDDYIDPEMYETLLVNLIEYNVDISHCGYQMVYPSKVDYYYNTGEKILQDKKKGIVDLLKGSFVEPGLWNKLYKKEIISNIKMSTGIRYNEDLLFNFYAFINSKSSFMYDKPLYYQVLRNDSSTHQSMTDHKLFDLIEVRKEIFEYCTDNLDVEIQSIAYSNYLRFLIYVYRIITIMKLKDKKKKAKEYKMELKAIKIKYSLCKRDRLERFLFFYLTPIHMLVYKLYEKFISNNKGKYEVK